MNKIGIDIGGQDTKAIVVCEGKVVDFIMNDKCAAGTGRFLEIMSERLDMSVNELCKNVKKRVAFILAVYVLFLQSQRLLAF